MIAKKFNIALSFLIKIATIPTVNPANPNEAIANVGSGKNAIIFMAIKTMKARLNPKDHLPKIVPGNSFMREAPYMADLSGLYHSPVAVS